MRGTTNIPSCYVLIRQDDKFLFVLRENTGYMDGKYSLPAGHVERAESFSQATARETLEEVKIIVAPEDLQHVFTMQRYQSDNNVRIDVFFEAKKWSGNPENGEPERHSKIEWISIADLSDKIMDYQLYALQQIIADKTYGELGWKN